MDKAVPRGQVQQYFQLAASVALKTCNQTISFYVHVIPSTSNSGEPPLTSTKVRPSLETEQKGKIREEKVSYFPHASRLHGSRCSQMTKGLRDFPPKTNFKVSNDVTYLYQTPLVSLLGGVPYTPYEISNVKKKTNKWTQIFLSGF